MIVGIQNETAWQRIINAKLAVGSCTLQPRPRRNGCGGKYFSQAHCVELRPRADWENKDQHGVCLRSPPVAQRNWRYCQGLRHRTRLPSGSRMEGIVQPRVAPRDTSDGWRWAEGSSRRRVLGGEWRQEGVCGPGVFRNVVCSYRGLADFSSCLNVCRAWSISLWPLFHRANWSRREVEIQLADWSCLRVLQESFALLLVESNSLGL